MKKKISSLSYYFLILFLGVLIGIFLGHNKKSWELLKSPMSLFHSNTSIKHNTWPADFNQIEIKSSLDSIQQKAYFYKTKSKKAKPLIVSLHPWNGTYTQRDSLADLCKEKDLNYIHPDFRGENQTNKACCSKFVLCDIEDAITYAINNSNTDTSKIYVIGGSGGGYAALYLYMNTKLSIRKFSAWASVTNLISWYDECKIKNKKAAEEILKCTDSKNGILNLDNAEERSPIFYPFPGNNRVDSKLMIYAGVNDGVNGSVSIMQSVNFYNKLLTDLKITDSSKYVSNSEKLFLLEHRIPLGEFGKISNRRICLEKEVLNIKLIIFEGAHEMLLDYALNELIE